MAASGNGLNRFSEVQTGSMIYRQLLRFYNRFVSSREANAAASGELLI